MKGKLLTLRLARQLSLVSIRKYRRANRAFMLLHNKRVGQIAGILGNTYKVNGPYAIAGWIHDIGRMIDAENHETHGLKIIEKKYEVSEVLRDCILNHGSSAKPTTPQGKIFQIADKLSVFDPEIIKMIALEVKTDEFVKSLAFLERMASGGIRLLRKWQAT